MADFWDHPIKTIEKALDIRRKIEALEENLSVMFGSGAQPSSPGSAGRDGGKRKRRIGVNAGVAKKAAAAPAVKALNRSGASRKKMAAAQRARRSKEKIAALLEAGNRLVW
jgi:hypothetical protein